MSYRLKITNEAAGQLLSIAMHYAEASQSFDIAVAWYDGFIRELESLPSTLHRHAVAPENDLFDFELSEMLYVSGKRLTHRALYRIVEGTIEVLTIRHHAQRPIQPGDVPLGP